MVKDNCLYLIWKEPKTRQRMIVGKLSKDNGYKFVYIQDYQKAKKLGWEMLKPFPETKVYESDVVFPVFSSRLPDPKRRDIEKILAQYGLKEYDEYDLLRKTGAKLPIDSYEFIDPIFPDDENISKFFYVAGTRHNAPCLGESCAWRDEIHVGDELVLEREKNNEYDEYAVRVSLGDLVVGYVPKFYSEPVSGRLDRGMSYSCTVTKVCTEKDCCECVQVHLQMPKC